MKRGYGRGGKDSPIFAKRDDTLVKPPQETGGKKYEIEDTSLMPFEESHFKYTGNQRGASKRRNNVRSDNHNIFFSRQRR